MRRSAFVLLVVAACGGTYDPVDPQGGGGGTPDAGGGGGGSDSSGGGGGDPTALFTANVKPSLDSQCTACHGAAANAALSENHKFGSTFAEVDAYFAGGDPDPASPLFDCANEAASEIATHIHVGAGTNWTAASKGPLTTWLNSSLAASSICN